ncbi:MBL fold metallo-hydrolase [Clostridium ljungdahlii]|uniref:Metallo-hydrolase YycJ n=1 Tax=Clostridium ljungdahlii (strain ATCC 55383 / DSM 13528 / PETC) TaxID=748727 RepID=D8GQQ5_CLOLD|nr:MBL fold metallo-hydrolase [Clostridium ljungdahlii]ADK16210.1 putative phage-related hydrolase [Clostridium ljungdahlii DSM 13528]OAA89920.1 putative metallo-hydrolase YycJ [Clostridium ljungdahlii DSM 13528]
MKLKVLGSGSSGNCYLLQNKDETLIIECGLSYKTILKGLNFDLRNVVGCLISHEHKDHSKAVNDVLNNAIDVYTSEETLKAINIKNYRAKIIRAEEQFNIGQFTILPIKTQHDAADPLGFLIYHSDFGKMLFITDSYYCQYKFSGLNHIMIECNYSMDILNRNIEAGLVHSVLANRLLKSHFSFDNVKEFLKVTDLSKTKEIVLLHLSNDNSNEDQFREEIEKLTGKPVYIADKELKIDLFS